MHFSSELEEQYGNHRSAVVFPCKVTLNESKASKVIENCLVTLSRMMDCDPNDLETFNVNDVAKIKPSPNALPDWLRYKTSRAMEQSMYNAPTKSLHPKTGQMITFSWTNYFYSEVKKTVTIYGQWSLSDNI